MKPTFPLGVAAGWQELVGVFVAAVSLLWAGVTVAGRGGWWAGAAAAAVVAAVALLSWRGAPLLTLMWPPRAVRGTAGELTDHDRVYGAGPVGIRAVGPYLAVVVAIDGQPHSPSVLDHHRVESLARLPLAAVAAGLRQFDVTLSGVDVVSVGVRRATEHHHRYAPVYSGRVGDHPAVGQRRTWLVARFDAASGARAVLWRDSVAATIGAAAEWLAQEVANRRCPARVLTAEEIAEADEQLLAGIDPATLRRGRGRLGHSGGYVTTYWMSPRDISTVNLDRLWVPDTAATVVAVQLRLTATGATTVGAVVRYHTGAPLLEAPVAGLNPLTGRHDLGMAAGLITAKAGLAVPARELAPGEHLSVAIGATGIIVGATAAGHPLLIDIGDLTGTATVTIAGELALTVQVALRAAATGYAVLVHTDRPARWKQVTGPGLQLVGPGGLAEQLAPTPRRPWVVVYDKVAGTAPQGAAVTVRTVPAGTASGADIHIEQDGAHSAVIRTWAFRYRLRIDLDYERPLTAA